jgi:hypothetical protein
VKHNALAKKQRSGNDWRLLGRSQFPAGLVSGEWVDHWLSETLEPFSLPADLRDKLRRSLEDELTPLVTTSNFSHVAVRIHIPQDVKTHYSSNRNWGFFKLTKTGITSDEETPANWILTGLLVSAAVSVIVLSGAKNLSRKHSRIQKKGTFS